MKNAHLIITLFVIILLSSCVKEETSVQKELLSERPSSIQLPNLSTYDVSIPEVPPYTGPEEIENSAEERATIEVYPGVNQLQDIINASDAGTRIKLMDGTHVEDETIVINRRIKLRGEDGAVLSLGGELGIYVIDARKTSIKDLEIVNSGTSVFGLAVEDTKLFEFEDNLMNGFYISIVLENTWKAEIEDNTIIGVNNDPVAGGFGVTLVNGNRAEISGNEVSINAFGIWACDKDGKAKDNVLHDNAIGLILCNVPAGSFSDLFAGGNGGSDSPATRWKVEDNVSHDNIWGYLVIDGAKDNRLKDNEGYNNAFVDIELAGETNQLFGINTPPSDDNEVDANGLNYIDCGDDNEVDDGVEVALPCSI